MANLPYVNGNENKVLGILKMYSRMGAYPLDATSVFNTKEDLENYISEAGSYAYPGQVIAVANGDITDSTQTIDYTLYVIRSDRTVQEIGKNPVFASVSEAESYVALYTDHVTPGDLLTVAEGDSYSLYVIKNDKTIAKVSAGSSDDEVSVTWNNLIGKPTSSADDIDAAVTKAHEHTNKDALDKFTENETTAKPQYDGNELAYKSDIVWDNLTGTPTTAAGYGITDVHTKTESESLFVKTEEVVSAAAANKILKLDENAKLPATILNGIIPIENLPHGALERCVVVQDDAARLALTTDDAQTGDTVKVVETGKMYFVKDSNNLNNESGYEAYTASSATAVEWAGVQNKPNTVEGYGITNAITTADVATSAEANKILKLNSDAKLPANITGDAATVGGYQASDFVLNSDLATEAAPNKLLKLNADGKLPADITGDADTIDGRHATDFVAASDVVTAAEPNKILKLNDAGKLAADVAGVADAAKSVEWTGITNTPTTIAGYGITDAMSTTEVVSTAEPNKILKLNAEGKLPTDITGNAATASAVEWVNVNGRPTTIAGYGITDAYSKTESDEKYVDKTLVSSTATAGVLLKLDENGKLPADITGNAATASSVDWNNIQNKPASADNAYTKDESDSLYVKNEEVVTTAAANKILKLNENAKIPANIIDGIIPLDNIPHGALERCIVVANDTARFALTTENAQTGDTVKVQSTGKMYFITDETQLSSEAGYEIYTAGSATSVVWAGITNKPTTIAGYGITDAYTKDESNTTFVAVSDVVTSASADKILRLDAEGKLPADITGNAATASAVEWANITNKPTTIKDTGINDVYNKTESDEKYVDKSVIVDVAEAGKVLKLNADGKLPADITGSAGSVAWENITDKPTSTIGEIDAAVAKAHEHTNKDTIDSLGMADERLTVAGNKVAYMSDVTGGIVVSDAEPEGLPVGGIWLDTSSATV